MVGYQMTPGRSYLVCVNRPAGCEPGLTAERVHSQVVEWFIISLTHSFIHCQVNCYYFYD